MKDEKNNGLFRKIINGNLTPKNLVALTPEEMANKELKEWRQAELKQDIEKIKSHELELLQLGSKIVLKSHKGEYSDPHYIRRCPFSKIFKVFQKKSFSKLCFFDVFRNYFFFEVFRNYFFSKVFKKLFF
jgi:hypothetical protein